MLLHYIEDARLQEFIIIFVILELVEISIGKACTACRRFSNLNGRFTKFYCYDETNSFNKDLIFHNKQRELIYMYQHTPINMQVCVCVYQV